MAVVSGFFGLGGAGFRLVLVLSDVVAERQQAVREVDVLDDGLSILDLQLGVREVPDGLHTDGADLVGDVVGHGLRHTEHGDVRLDIREDIVERGKVVHDDAVHLLTDEIGVDVERSLEREAVLLKAEVFHERAADVADADQNGRVVAVHTEDLGDLAAQRHHVVAVALLAEFAEAAEVLTDLRGSQPHLAAKLTGRDAFDPGSVQVVELAEIAGHSSDHIVRYFDTFHE